MPHRELPRCGVLVIAPAPRPAVVAGTGKVRDPQPRRRHATGGAVFGVVGDKAFEVTEFPFVALRDAAVRSGSPLPACRGGKWGQGGGPSTGVAMQGGALTVLLPAGGGSALMPAQDRSLPSESFMSSSTFTTEAPTLGFVLDVVVAWT